MFLLLTLSRYMPVGNGILLFLIQHKTTKRMVRWSLSWKKKKIKKFAIFCSYSYIERQKKATKWKEYHPLKNQKWKHEDFNICFVYKALKVVFWGFWRERYILLLHSMKKTIKIKMAPWLISASLSCKEKVSMSYLFWERKVLKRNLL